MHVHVLVTTAGDERIIFKGKNMYKKKKGVFV
jgi:hypothetical protein